MSFSRCSRYVAIVHPMSYSHLVTRQRVLASIAAAWCFAFVISLPPLFGMGRCAEKKRGGKGTELNLGISKPTYGILD